jgi:hypothetical protein
MDAKTESLLKLYKAILKMGPLQDSDLTRLDTLVEVAFQAGRASGIDEGLRILEEKSEYYIQEISSPYISEYTKPVYPANCPVCKTNKIN